MNELDLVLNNVQAMMLPCLTISVFLLGIISYLYMMRTFHWLSSLGLCLSLLFTGVLLFLQIPWLSRVFGSYGMVVAVIMTALAVIGIGEILCCVQDRLRATHVKDARRV